MKGTYSRMFTEEQLDDIARLYREGRTILAISIVYNCSPAPIRNALILRGVRRRPATRTGKPHKLRAVGAA